MHEMAASQEGLLAPFLENAVTEPKAEDPFDITFDDRRRSADTQGIDECEYIHSPEPLALRVNIFPWLRVGPARQLLLLQARVEFHSIKIAHDAIVVELPGGVGVSPGDRHREALRVRMSDDDGVLH